MSKEKIKQSPKQNQLPLNAYLSCQLTEEAERELKCSLSGLSENSELPSAKKPPHFHMTVAHSASDGEQVLAGCQRVGEVVTIQTCVLWYTKDKAALEVVAAITEIEKQLPFQSGITPHITVAVGERVPFYKSADAIGSGKPIHFPKMINLQTKLVLVYRRKNSAGHSVTCIIDNQAGINKLFGPAQPTPSHRTNFLLNGTGGNTVVRSANEGKTILRSDNAV